MIHTRVGRDVAVGVLVAEQAGEDRDNEQAEHGEPERQNHGGMRDHPPERVGEQIDLRARRAAHGARRTNSPNTTNESATTAAAPNR